MTPSNPPASNPNQSPASEILVTLAQFTGSERYFRGPNRTIVYTDGVQYLAEAAQAYWLIDAIASWQVQPKVRAEPFQVWTLTRQTEWRLQADDGNGNVMTTQKIEYSDFPLEGGIKLYLAAGGPEGRPVLMLTSEY